MKRLVIIFLIIAVIFIYGCISQEAVTKVGSEEQEAIEEPEIIKEVPAVKETEPEEDKSVSEPESLVSESFCKNQQWPPDCDMIPFEQGRKMCNECRELGVGIFEEQHKVYEEPSKPGEVLWEYMNNKWVPSGTPPKCPESFPQNFIEKTPVDMKLVTSVLYPGQIRGGHYKAHGGFRFDNLNTEDITVILPQEGSVVSGSRYIENGELQYLFDIIHPCGIMYRFDHLLTLSPKFQDIAEKLSEPKVDDSRGTRIRPPIKVEVGEVIATAVGLKKTKNVFVDFGVYDLRQTNKAAEDPAWLQEYGGEQASYALCWLDLLPGEDSAKTRNLPGSGVEGKQSDYC